MTDLCAPRKKRHHPAIIASAEAFSNALHNKEYDKAARIAFQTTLEVLGVKGLMAALDEGNNFWKRRRTLE